MNRIGLCTLVALVLCAEASADDKKVPQEFNTIQEAVNAAAAGDVVVVSKGSYRENVVVATAGITLKGKAATIDGEYKAPCIFVNGVNDVTITGFTLINGTDAIDVEGDGAIITKNRISASGKGIDVDGDNATISQNSISFCHGYGIDYVATSTFPASSTSSTTIEKNNISDIAQRGIGARNGQLIVNQNKLRNLGEGPGIELDPTSDSGVTSVTRNQLANTNNKGIEVVDITFHGGVLVQRNRVATSQGDGILVRTNGPITIESNRVTDAAGCGIVVNAFADKGAMVLKNKIIRSTRRGIDSRGPDIDIMQNSIVDSNKTGIDHDGDKGVISRNKVKNSNAQGIDFRGDMNTVESNSITQSGKDGIRVAGSTNVIKNNKITDNHGDGIDIGNDALLMFTGNEVTGNLCIGNAHEGIDNTGLDTIIDDNVAKKNGGAFGPDIAGQGKDVTGDMLADGTVASFSNNKTGAAKGAFAPGDGTTPQRLDL